MMKHVVLARVVAVLACSLSAFPSLAEAPQPPAPPANANSLFDPARHMRVSEVKPGMKGYCLTVFSGTTIEKFEVEVISVTKNLEPGFDAVLINCTGGGTGPGRGLEHLGAVEGMSGSPVFLYDDTGKARMIGAFAFGFPFAKDAIAGVQPIEYMLRIADPKLPRIRSDGGGGGGVTSSGANAGLSAWNWPEARNRALAAAAKTPTPRSAGLQRTGLSVGVSGVSPRTLTQLTPLLDAQGIHLLDSAAVAGKPLSDDASAKAGSPEPRLEPGSSLVVPLVTGDAEIAALGTCTEVIGDRVFGFGHLFQGEGGTELPMAAGYVNTIIANLNASFKVGSSTKVLGVLRSDTNVGVGGVLGTPARTIPATVRVRYSDGSLDRTYHYQLVRHNQFTPVLSVISSIISLNGDRNLPAVNTLHLSQRIRMVASRPGRAEGGEKDLGELSYSTLIPDANVMQLFFQTGVPLIAASNNPFGTVLPGEIETEILVEPGVSRQAELVEAISPRTTYKPGESVNLVLTYRPWHQKEQTRTLAFDLPSDLRPGQYTLAISDAETFQGQDVASRPDLYRAENVQDVFHVLQRASSFHPDALYLRLTRMEGDGPNPGGRSPNASSGQSLAVGRKPLLKLPDSRRQIIENGAKPNVASLTETHSKSVPWSYVTVGATELAITVETETNQLAGPPSPSIPNPMLRPHHLGKPGRPGADRPGPGGEPPAGQGPALPGE